MTQVRRGNRTPSRAPASDTFDWFWSDFQLVGSPQLEFESRVTARSFSRAPQLSSRSVSASAAETAAGRLGRRTGMPAALAAVKPASAAASGRQRSHSCWCGTRCGSRCAEKIDVFAHPTWGGETHVFSGEARQRSSSLKENLDVCEGDRGGSCRFQSPSLFLFPSGFWPARSLGRSRKTTPRWASSPAFNHL